MHIDANYSFSNYHVKKLEKIPLFCQITKSSKTVCLKLNKFGGGEERNEISRKSGIGFGELVRINKVSIATHSGRKVASIIVSAFSGW